MATNKLLEAAAEILAGSKKSAPAMPMQKPEGATTVDMGGPTPQDSKPEGDSNKIDATKGAKSATAPTTKPSAASSDTQNKPAGGKNTMREDEEHDEELIDEVEDADAIAEFKARMKEDVNSLFGDDQTISEDFKSKAATIFEARVIDRVTQIQEDMESQYASMLEEAVETIKSDLTEKVDDYLNYVVEQWMEENQIAIESGLRSEITEDFIAGLRNLFAENYINVPEDKVDLVEELASKVEELETKLNEEIETNIEYKKALNEAIKEQLTVEVCEGLTATQVEKIKALAESVDFSTEEEFKDKLETLRENYFPSGIQKANVSQLQEQFEDTEEKKVIHDPFISAVSQAISKTKI
jgi:hypothetical protein